MLLGSAATKTNNANYIRHGNKLQPLVECAFKTFELAQINLIGQRFNQRVYFFASVVEVRRNPESIYSRRGENILRFQ